MIRAALALYEATGERDYLEQALDLAARVRRALRRRRHRRLLSDRRRRRRPAAAAAFDRRRRHAQSERDRGARIWCGSQCSTGDDAWREKADRLIEGILSAAERNLFGHVALLNALDLRLRGAEIVVTGPEADRFAQAALKLPFLDRIVLRAASAADLPANASGAGKAESHRRERGLRLRRRDLLAAGYQPRCDRRDSRRDDAALIFPS